MKAPFPYYGGKGRAKLKNEILSLIPSYRTYCEPCAGAGSIFFNLKNYHNTSEILNDTNENLVNFYRIAKTPHLFEKLNEMANATLFSQAEFRRAQKIYFNSDGYGRVARAWATWAGFCMAYAADLHPGAVIRFGKNRIRRKINKEVAGFLSNVRNLNHIADRLKTAHILQLDCLECIEKVDSPGAFFFIDPPYHDLDMGHLRKTGWTKKRLIELLQLLPGIKGKFLLTYTLCDEIENARKKNNWNGKDIHINNSVGFNVKGKIKGKIAKRIESLTWNYELQKTLF